MQRLSYLWHRYLGIGLCLLFALWFISGVVMLYARFPILTPEDRFPLQPRFEPAAFVLTPQEAGARLGLTAPPRRVRLQTLLDRPIYYILPVDQPWAAVYADDGSLLGPVDADLAGRVIRQTAPDAPAPTYVALVKRIDQWTLTNSLNLHRPLHKFALGDDAGTEMYVAEKTGEVVMRTTRMERLLSWVGPILHWGAPELLRKYVWAWRQAILWLSVAGTLLVVTGMAVGMLRYRRRGYALKGVAPDAPGLRWASSPYLGAKLQHHWLGLVFGTVTLTWIVSGLLYLNPGGRYQGDLSTTTQMTPYSVGGVRGSMSPRPGQADAMRGGPLDLALWTESPGDAWARVDGAAGGEATLPKEIELHRFAGQPSYIFYSAPFDSVTVAADNANQPPFERYPTDALIAQAQQAVAGDLLSAELIDRYDAYYYAVGDVAPKRLPVLRLRFEDPVTSLMYVTPHSGTIFRSYDLRAKVMRWLVMGLHCLDFPFLILNRPAWDLTIIVFSAGGLLLSLTGVLMGWRRVRPRTQRSYLMRSATSRVRTFTWYLLAAGLLWPVGAGASAQDDPQTESEQAAPSRHFETVVVTGSVEEERLGDIAVTVQTFDRDEIAQSSASTVTEFLAERSVAFFSAWTPAQTSINIRGGATDGQGRDIRSQVVVLVNGRRSGTANISKLGLHDVERIEVLRGPGSLVYGSQALGGVINLITKDGLSAAGPFLRLNAGSFGLVDSVAQYGGTSGNWDYFVSAHGGRRGDYEAGGGAVESPMRNTGYKQGGGMAALGYTHNAFQRMALTVRSDGMYDAGFRGSSWDWDNIENRTNDSIDLVYSGQSPNERANWEVQSSYFRDVDDLKWGAEVVRTGSGAPGVGVDLDRNVRRQTGFGLRGSTTLRATPANSVQLGLDSAWSSLRNNRVRTPLPGRTASQVAPFDNNSDSRNLGLFVEDVHRVLDDRLILRGGVRFDAGRHEIRATPNVDNLRERAETYDAFTYRFGATARPAEDVSVRFSVGTGYRAPTPTELAVDYVTVIGSQILGNPALEPERTTSIEVGTALERDRFWVDVALFQNDITNRIEAVAPIGSTTRVFQNHSESEVAGLEFQGRVDLATLGSTTAWAGANGVYHFRMRDLDAAAQNLSTDRIIRMYESQATVTVGLASRAWSAQVAGTYHGPIWYDTEENLIPLGELSRSTIHEKGTFMVWRLRGRHRLAEGLWATASIDNLFNKNEHPLFIAINKEPLLADLALSNGGFGNSMPGRAFVLGLEFRP